jgi:hypothetical protein
MSLIKYHTVSATELFYIASDASNVKIQTLVKKIYNDIIAAAHDGKFSLIVRLEGNDFGALSIEERVALENIDQLFPGIQTTTDMRFLTRTFAWPNPMIED